MWGNVSSDLFIHRKFLLPAWRNFASLTIQIVSSEDSDQAVWKTQISLCILLGALGIDKTPSLCWWTLKTGQTAWLCRLIWVITVCLCPKNIQSTLVISNSKGLSEILRDILTLTYQICRIEEKVICLTTFNKYMCNWTLEVRDILKILWKRGEIAP